MAKLERLTKGRGASQGLVAPPEAHPPEAQPAEPMAPPMDAPTTSGAVGEARTLLREMEELRGQLESAFDESFDRLGRLEADSAAARSQLTEALQQGDDTSSVVDGVRDSMAALSALTTQSLARIEQVDEAVRSLARPADREVPAIDLAAIDQRLDVLVKQLGQRLAADRARLEDGLAAMTKELTSIVRTPMTVDTTALEDATHRGALHNAADIANLRRDIEVLTEAVRLQDKGIGEVRTTLEWIKDRLLLR